MKNKYSAAPGKSLRVKIEKMGWRSLDDRLWEKLDEYRSGIVILAPPLDTIPSPHGNAIYSIVQDLAERSPVPCLVLAIQPESGEPAKCSISDRILYCQKPFQPLPFEYFIPHRVKKFFWGTGRPEVLGYAKKAARVCQYLGVHTIVVEDVPRFGLAFRKEFGPKANIFLHQHIDAPLSHSTIWWKWIKQAFTGMIFVARKTISDTEARHGTLSNVTVVYNGVDLHHYDPQRWGVTASRLRMEHQISEKELIVLYVGRVIPGKGCLELAEAFLSAGVPHSRLIILGNLSKSLFGNELYTKRLINLSHNNPNKLTLVGNVPQAEIPGWYQASTLVVVPSIQSEGLPKVITEALAIGKPVLATDRGGSFELIRPGQNGWLLENPENIEQFSKQLREILQDRKQISEFGQNAYDQDRPKLGIDQCALAFFNFILLPHSNTQTD